MTPEMWLDLSPSHTVFAHFVADRQTSSEVQRGVALQSSGLASFVCHPPSVVLLVPRLGGLGHKIFSCRQPQAALLYLCGVSVALTSPA